MTFYIDSKKADSPRRISALLKKCILCHPEKWTEIVFLCVGTDRTTGDCLGPYIGQQLLSHAIQGIYVYGTLFQPVHALNLQETIEKIHQHHPDSFIIAIDASLGIRKHLGYLTISKGALEPGLGVRKKLPPIGDISITGIVNTTGTFDHLSLQMTKLSTIVSMADSIVSGVLIAYGLLLKRPAISTVSQKF